MEKKPLYSIVLTKQKPLVLGIRLIVGNFNNLDEALESAEKQLPGYAYFTHLVTPHPGEDVSDKK